MNAPMNRDQQIALMKNAKTIVAQHIERLKNDSQVRALISTPPEDNEHSLYEMDVQYMRRYA